MFDKPFSAQQNNFMTTQDTTGNTPIPSEGKSTHLSKSPTSANTPSSLGSKMQDFKYQT